MDSRVLTENEQAKAQEELSKAKEELDSVRDTEAGPSILSLKF